MSKVQVILVFFRKKDMLLLPLGLLARLYRIPFATIFLVGLMIAFSGHFVFLNPDRNWSRLVLLLFQIQSDTDLISTILLLLVFGSYVELRIGSFFFLVSYMIGALGSVPLVTYFLKSIVISAPLMACATILGLFFAFFSTIKYRFLIYTFPKKIKLLTLPSWAFLIFCQLIAIAADLYFKTPYNFYSLIGYLFGFVLVMIWSEVVYLKRGFVFPIEVHYLLMAKAQTDPVNKIDYILDCIRVNPNNLQAMEYLFRSIAKSKIAAHFFTPEQKEIISNLITSIIKKDINADLNLIIYNFSLLPLSWSLNELGLKNIEPEDLDFIDELLEKAQWQLALRFYDAYIMNDSDDEERSFVMATIQRTILELKRVGLKPDDEKWLAKYIYYNPNSYVTGAIKLSFKLEGSSGENKPSGDAA